MIPIKDHNPSGGVPIVTYLLLASNILIFIFMQSMSLSSQEEFIYTYSLIPREIINGIDLYTLFSSMFLHGSIGHVVGNMLFLNIFGDNLESTLGHIKYLLFYLAAGLVASFAQILTDPTSQIPNLGASGAIAGLMGGYLLLYPRHKIDILLPIGLAYRTATVPAYTMLFYWIIAQVFSGVGQFAVESTGGVAYFAHIGGFLAGLILIWLLRGAGLTRKSSAEIS